jgi:hypothetical protein
MLESKPAGRVGAHLSSEWKELDECAGEKSAAHTVRGNAGDATAVDDDGRLRSCAREQRHAASKREQERAATNEAAAKEISKHWRRAERDDAYHNRGTELVHRD